MYSKTVLISQGSDIDKFYLPEDFKPIGDTVEESTGRPGTTILYDQFGVAHVTGQTREDMAFAPSSGRM